MASFRDCWRSTKKQPLKDTLDCLAKDDTNDRRRAAALLGLPRYTSGEDPSTVIRMCDAHADFLDDAMKGMQVDLLIACEGGEQGAIPHQVFNVGVVVEETIVLHNIKDVTLGFVTLMVVIYCVNLKYPEDMKYSFEFLQSGDEDQTRPGLSSTTWFEKQNPEVQTVTSGMFSVLFSYIRVPVKICLVCSMH
ncbi:PREDICTED: uncharacterized protein LOC106924119 isoform X2 [Poecilia mexicana]|uniref:uncharacterized protein LOC106924119 isoform X2 n=1 Tax=Poecilia mexicana TaxID=48701 RepID=UPI00072E6988|nr:PREDICTED: uncharacterized protein LOC106924119 isoform X2 [Poecilia mexicana]